MNGHATHCIYRSIDRCADVRDNRTVEETTKEPLHREQTLLQHQLQDREHQLQEQGGKPTKVQQGPQLKRTQDFSQSGGKEEELQDLWQEIMLLIFIFVVFYPPIFITVFYPSYFSSYRL